MTSKELFEAAQVERDNGQIDQAILHYQQLRDQSLDSGDRFMAAEVLHMIGVAYYQDNRYQEAETALIQAKDEFEVLKNLVLVGAVNRDLGLVYFKRNNYQKAQQYLDESISILQATGSLAHLGISKVKLGLVLSAQGNLDEAESLARLGLDDLKRDENRLFEALGYYDLAKILEAAQKPQQAIISLKQAQAVLDKFPQDQFMEKRHQIQQLIDEITTV